MQYIRLNRMCHPQTIAYSSNHKFLTNDLNNIRPMPIKQPEGQTIQKCNVSGCTMKKNDPKIWGPPLWKYMHYSAANYPEHPSKQQVSEMVSWLCSLPSTIPCKNCSVHFREYMDKYKKQLPNICSNKESLFIFLVDIHNKVNERNNKPNVSYEDAKKIYSY